MDIMITAVKEMKGEIQDLKVLADEADGRVHRAEEHTLKVLVQYDKEKRRADDALEELRLSENRQPLPLIGDANMIQTPTTAPFTPMRRWPALPPLPNPQQAHVVIELDDSSDDDMSVDHLIPLPKPQHVLASRNASPGPSTTPTMAPPTRRNPPLGHPVSKFVRFTSLKGKGPEVQQPLTPTPIPKVAGKSKVRSASPTR